MLKITLSHSLLFCFAINTVIATNYYVSTINGQTGNSGTSPGNAWRNLSQLPPLAPGDSVFLEAGSTFRESLILFQGGHPGAPAVITSYGSGAKPVISGADVITGWTQSESKYHATHTGIGRNFFVNNKEMILARTPDEDNYYWLDTGTKYGLSDAQLPELAGFWNDAKVCVHNTQWSWEKTSVQSHTAGTLTFTDSLRQGCLPGYAYFLYDMDTCLSTSKEWFYDWATNLVHPLERTNSQFIDL